VKGVRAFERIAYLAIENCLISKEVSNKGERERSGRGKERLIQQMVVITISLLI